MGYLIPILLSEFVCRSECRSIEGPGSWNSFGFVVVPNVSELSSPQNWAPSLAVAGSALVLNLSLVPGREHAQLLNETVRTSGEGFFAEKEKVVVMVCISLVIDGGWGAFRPALSVINEMCADCPHRHQRSKGGQGPNEDIKADPGAGVPAISGDEIGRASCRERV